MKITRENAAPAQPVQGSFPPAAGGYFKGMLACIVATLLFGTMFPVMTHALTHIDPFSFTALRYVTAGVAFLIFLRIREGAGAFGLDGHSGWLAWALGS